MPPWEVYCLVSDANTQRSVTFIRDENPFLNSHAATLGNSYSTATYDFAWAGDSATFHVTAQHRMAQLDGIVSSGGSIRLTPAVDTLFSVQAQYTFAWPGSVLGIAQLQTGLADATLDHTIYGIGQSGGNIGLGQPFGTLTLSRTELLVAGHDYGFSYFTRMILDPTPPGTSGDASGEFIFTLTPVPEPAALAPLFLIALARSIPAVAGRRRMRTAAHFR